jgi:hypothetical protein
LSYKTTGNKFIMIPTIDFYLPSKTEFYPEMTKTNFRIMKQNKNVL